jgi:predicted flap endonuclease-1-like 5' DNA nuclease
LVQVEGIGKVYAEKLALAGVSSARQFLQEGASPAGRKRLAEVCGLGESRILEWLNHLDLMRVKGIGPEFSDLLEEAGVDTVMELARRNPQNLTEALRATNAQKRLVRRLPPLAMVENWVAQAKELPRLLTY